MRVGDVCDLFDGQGNIASASITQIEKKSAQAQWSTSASRATANESPLHISLAQCLSSADKMDWTIEKAVELGVTEIVPLFSTRSQVKLSPERIAKKLEHWQRIIIAACAQSGRNVCPRLHSAQPIQTWLSSQQNTNDYKIIFHPDENLSAPQRLKELTAPHAAQAIQLLVGPESGFDAREIDSAQKCGFRPKVLGQRVLRTETAGLAAIAALQALWGDF